jgi:hypothetical protein
MLTEKDTPDAPSYHVDHPEPNLRTVMPALRRFPFDERLGDEIVAPEPSGA